MEESGAMQVSAFHLTRVSVCPHCGSTDGSCYELRDYDPIWRDGKIFCKETGEFIRDYDAG